MIPKADVAPPFSLSTTGRCHKDQGPISCRYSAAQEIIMQSSKLKPVSLTVRLVAPWNKGDFVGPKPPLKPKQV